MGVKIAREPDGRVSIAVQGSPAAVISPVEARLLAIKLLLAAEQLEPATVPDSPVA
jgi:hypothetical protein